MSNINMNHVDSMLQLDQINGDEIFLHTDASYLNSNRKLKKKVLT